MYLIFLDQMSGGFSGSMAAMTSVNFGGTITNRLHMMKTSQKVEGTLLIGAFATTRHVRTFKKMVIDPNKLHGLPGKDKYVILTEAVMGGAFVGMIHFKKKEDKNRITLKSQTQVNGESSIGDIANLLQQNFSKTSAMEIDTLASSAGLDIFIEFNCLGALPTLKRHEEKYSIMKYTNLNPSRFEVSKEEENEVKEISKALNGKRPAGELLLEHNMKRRIRERNAGIAFSNNFRETTTTEKALNVHTMESLHEAFESFLEQMQRDPDCGIPIGFNYCPFNIEAQPQITISPQ